jgi:hypothetical protein
VTDNQGLERRPDVVVFTSERLRENLEIAGEITAEISVVRDNPHADLFVRLCDVDERGKSLNVCDGITRLTGTDPLDGVTRVRLYGTAHRFAAGHRVRLQVSGGAHPRFARNPGTGAIDAAAAELRDTRYRIRTGASAVILPLIVRPMDAGSRPMDAGSRPMAKGAILSGAHSARASPGATPGPPCALRARRSGDCARERNHAAFG